MSYGFFNTDEYEDKTVVTKSASCGSCRLFKKCITPRMKPSGGGKKGIFILAEAPGRQEDKRGTQLVGKSGRRLKNTLKEIGIRLHQDCRKYNAINCRPPKNATPTAAQIEACRPNIIKEIQKYKPKLIIALGTVAIKSLIGYRYHGKVAGINKWRGYVFPDYDNDCWFASTFHPSFIERDKGGAADLIFRKDLKVILSYLNKPLPPKEELERKVCVLRETRDAQAVIESTLKYKPTILAFDYETTGLKPHAKGHRIVTCGICHDSDIAYAFPVDNRIRSLFRRLLSDNDIKKVAANMKFEELWSRERMRKNVSSWIWDTMLAAHCLDNRSNSTSLRFQSLINWGIWDYDSHISPFLKSVDDKNANSINKIHQIDIQDLLVYNGIDALLEYRLALKQMLAMGILDPVKYAKTRHINRETNIHEQHITDQDKAERRRKIKSKAKRQR